MYLECTYSINVSMILTPAYSLEPAIFSRQAMTGTRQHHNRFNHKFRYTRPKMKKKEDMWIDRALEIFNLYIMLSPIIPIELSRISRGYTIIARLFRRCRLPRKYDARALQKTL